MDRCPHGQALLADWPEKCPYCDEPLPQPTEPSDWQQVSPTNVLGDWPNGDDNEPETPALLTSMDNINMRLDALRGMLDAMGIATFVPAPRDTEISKIYLGGTWQNRFEFDVFVPQSRHEEALELLNAPPVFEESEETT